MVIFASIINILKRIDNFKHMKKLTYVKTMLACMALLILGACSGKKDDNKNLPQDKAEQMKNVSTDGVIFISANLIDVFENSGGTVENNHYSLGTTVKQLIRKFSDENPQNIEQKFNMMVPMIDPSSIIIKVFADNHFICSVPVKEKEALIKMLDRKGRPVKSDSSFSTYSLDDVYVMVMGDLVWATDDPEVVINDVNRAQSNPIYNNDYMTDLFTQNTGAVLIDINGIKSIRGIDRNFRDILNSIPKDVANVVGTFNLKGNDMGIKFIALDKSYKPCENPVVTEKISPLKASEFASLPADADVVVGLGQIDKNTLNSLANVICDEAGVDGFYKMVVTEFINGINGSIVGGISFPKDGGIDALQDPMEYNATVAIGFNQDTAEAILPLIAQAPDVYRSGNGYRYDLRIDRNHSISIYFGYKNNQLVVSTMPLEKGGYRGGSQLDGSLVGATVNIDKNSIISREAELPWGIAIKLLVGSSSCDINLGLTDTDGYMLENILNLFLKHADDFIAMNKCNNDLYDYDRLVPVSSDDYFYIYDESDTVECEQTADVEYYDYYN